MKINSKLLTYFVIVVLLIAFIAYIDTHFKTYAILKAEEFCRMFNISYENKPFAKFISKNSSPTGSNFGTKKHATGDIYVSFPKVDQYSNEYENINFIMGRASKEIEVYYNLGLKNKLAEKYGKTVSKDNPRGRVNWPEPLPLDKVKEIINSIGAKLRIPSDMVLDKMENKVRDGVWNAYFVREKDGYRYKEDKIAISIMAATGDFVGYTKTYQGTSCPTDVKIDEEEVVEHGWKKLQKHLSNDLQKKLKEIYKVKAELLIVQDKGYFFTKDKSRLAWVVKYDFTGGIDSEIKLAPSYEYTKEELETVSVLMGRRYREWRKIGQPPWPFEIHFDAATGKELYITSVMPNWLNWLSK